MDYRLRHPAVRVQQKIILFLALQPSREGRKPSVMQAALSDAYLSSYTITNYLITNYLIDSTRRFR